MNNNPFPSQTTTGTDAKNAGRSRVKLAVYSVVAVHVAGLVALLLTQGCRQQTPPVEEAPLAEQPEITNETSVVTDTSVPFATDSTNPPVVIADPLPPVQPVPPVATTYEVKAGDSFTTIAAANQTTVPAITAANPGVDSRRLKIGQKLNLPAPSAVTTPAPVAVVDANLYVVKSGDTLGGIAKANGTTVRAIKALNGLATDAIKVGQKLKLPPKVTAPAEVPPLITDPAPVATPGTVPVR